MNALEAILAESESDEEAGGLSLEQILREDEEEERSEDSREASAF